MILHSGPVFTFFIGIHSFLYYHVTLILRFATFDLLFVLELKFLFVESYVMIMTHHTIQDHKSMLYVILSKA